MSKQVVIIGAGVVGSFAAWHCLRRGLSVTVIDRGDDAREGCSFGNAGLVVPSHFVPLAAPGMVWQALKWTLHRDAPLHVPPRLSPSFWSWAWRFWRASSAARVERAAPLLRDLLMAGRTRFEELAEAWDNDFGYDRTGLLLLCRTPECLEGEAHHAERATRLGIEADVLDRAGVARRDPHVRMDVCGGVWFPGDGRLDPRRLMRRLRERLVAAGCRFVWNADVRGFVQRERRLHAVLTSVGEIEGDEFVLAGGAWSGELARRVGMRLPMEAGAGYSLTLANPPALPSAPSICVEARLAVTPLGNELRFGGMMELSGLKSPICSRRVQGMIHRATTWFPDFRPEHFEGSKPWQGLRPLSCDGLPYVGRTAACDNFVIAAGHAMLGVSLAPVTGDLVAAILAEENAPLGLQPHDLALLSPDRYAR